MKLLVIVILMVGVMMVMQGYFRQNMQCPPPKVVYKYLPRSFTEEQESPIPVSDIFGAMFKQPSPLEAGSGLG